MNFKMLGILLLSMISERESLMIINNSNVTHSDNALKSKMSGTHDRTAGLGPVELSLIRLLVFKKALIKARGERFSDSKRTTSNTE